ncbi:hypothetical protein DQ04_00371040 [Trypanosoma grayi]|uniref:hypothetical protein n=1 Tax=Trypanosoma grayi TaxID=71804 RepID=UPI0004F45D10|nr:hypothetical protein DQ04_00371040 [Trypanosoma grayi]KEG14618.1 hypothetical protein DQ04_00371040 [Trypanosoma grayi]
MRRVLTSWLFTPRVSATVASAATTTAIGGVTGGGGFVSSTRSAIVPFGMSALHITVRGAATAAAVGDEDTKKKRRGRRKATSAQSAVAESPEEGRHVARSKGNTARRTKHATQPEVEGAGVVFGDEAGDVMDGNAATWGEDEVKMRELDALEGGEDGDHVPLSPRRRGRRAAYRTTGGDEEIEGEDNNNNAGGEEEEEGGDASGESPVGDGAIQIADEESRFLKDRFPDLATEYDVEANQEPVDEVFFDSARVASWKCVECGFKWKSGVFVRTCLRTKCPQCEKERNPCLASRFVQLWDHALNDPCVDPKTVVASSSKSAYWRCPNCSTSYQARIKDVVGEKAKCPSCSLLNIHADFSKDENGLLQEWHPLKNGDLQPSQVKPTDQTKLWWLCMACGHEWEATLAARLSKTRRTKGKECPVCHGKKKI